MTCAGCLLPVLSLLAQHVKSSAIPTKATDTRALQALALVPVVFPLYSSRVSQGCSLLHLIVFCLLSAMRPQKERQYKY